MHHLKKKVLIGMAVLGLSGAAFAASGDQARGSGSDRASAHSMHQHDGAKFRERMEKRQAALHDKLNLAQDQEAAWKAFTAAMTSIGHAQRPARGDWANLSAPERMERMLERSNQRQQRMASRLAAVKNFYSQLAPEQQKIFNDNFAKPHRYRRHHGRS